MQKLLESALAALKNGQFVVLYDGDEREGEADLIFHAKFATPEKIEMMRKDAGGLICFALSETISEKLKLPFYTDMIADKPDLVPIIIERAAYGDKPAFSISVNHKDVYTGIPDNDRALTIRKLAETIIENEPLKKFRNEFRTPGHMFLLIGRGLENRKGHTELSLKLAELANITQTIVLCEMLGSGKALTKKEAIEYAKKKNLVFLEEKDILLKGEK
ncbi:MAG: 3,4-dihydroxy-2-butanone-4-phosphate synthase [Candidatus Micrarchaeota archaeon]|nr:3,4-dihydroxy-2-butanone-4-phosphate synthase [Candidatus Micrarchaeota archaeon]